MTACTFLRDRRKLSALGSRFSVEGRPETPEGGCTEKHDENHSGEAAGRGSFAPRLEHRNRSNEEKEDRAGSEDFQQYVYSRAQCEHAVGCAQRVSGKQQKRAVMEVTWMAIK